MGQVCDAARRARAARMRRRPCPGVRRYRGPRPRAQRGSSSMTDQGARTAPRTAATTGLGAAVTLDALAGRPYDAARAASARSSRSPGYPSSAAGWSPGGTCASRSCATLTASPSTIRASPRRRSSGRACCRSMARSTAGTATRSRRRSTSRRSPRGSRHASRTPHGRWSPALAPRGGAEIRRDLAGPLAVEVVAAALDLLDTEPAAVLGWYDEIVAAVDRVSVGGEIGPARGGRRTDAGAPCLEHDRARRRRPRRGHRARSVRPRSCRTPRS